ncbi:aldolase [Candidatus Falkowbacteria bacterium]|uniref:fructose-bisphosphate aldolase n=1 Tax=Candidatus Falkowbacteria bacterium CG10_big_fil_rev_8_21_14_0_10_37_18 TaxID=1974562 RepID=A0A2H0V8F9_9BACT|nr:aldolase [Candidatus Falkowbacteria bacterium]NCQ12904.1 aldolase [Candidatus Falkowbacteria bacterium]OIO06359.1 MAG: hypothetical protein AUJ26_00945 [Candidatus Falkowbacteria bacterium CG1_02_37_21]PIR95397.1 MAG: aldolase [Candidatus Falkowbacteria bacterium CG10_big_fil_rev_8_21_14_0_10_37_18]
MTDFKIPASVPGNKKSEYSDNYRKLTKNRGNLFLIAGDQKVEHLNDDFIGANVSSEDASPEHLFKIAAASQGGVLAAHLGLISHYGHNYKQVPYIIKLNGKSNLGPNDDKDSSPTWWTIADIVKFKKQSGLNIVGIGYTIYLGGKFESQLLATAASAIWQAHQAGLTAVIWMYPRGKNVKEENIHTIAGGAGMAAALDADFVKIKYPYGSKNTKLTAKKFQEAVMAAGHTKVICVGGSRRTVSEMLKELEEQIKISGTTGLAMGRNLHQRSLEEATRLTAALGSIIFDNKSAKEALVIYNNKTKKAKKNYKFLGLF